ncbi:MAG: glycosyltransferase [Planctomycetota bacterium]|nr:glycosyltransferase [Planctomycetota bacterium]
MSPRAPRVLVSAIALSQPMGGVLRQALELLPRVARLLDGRGGSLDLLISRDGLDPRLEQRLPGSVGRIPTAVPPGGPLTRALSEPRALRAALQAAQAAGRPYDLVHTGHLPVPAFDTPLAFLIHDLRDLEPGGGPWWRRRLAAQILPRAFRRAARVLTVSETMGAELVARFPVVEGKLHVVRHGADHLPVLERAPGPMGCERLDTRTPPGAGGERDPRPPIVHLGHLERRKNLELLLEAMALAPDLPPLLLAGRAKGSEDLRLAARARALGVAGRVAITGPVAEKELPGLLASAGCLVIPSKIEGFGIPALEAQRASLPLAVARAGALVEVSAPGTPSFDPEDAPGCAAAVRKSLSSSPGDLLVAKAFAEGFRWDASAEALLTAWGG